MNKIAQDHGAPCYALVNNQDWHAKKTFAANLQDALGWESDYARYDDCFRPTSTMGSASQRQACGLEQKSLS
jgi:hypothetical protein